MLQEAMASDGWKVPGFNDGIDVPPATLETRHAAPNKAARGRRSIGQIKSQILPDYATLQTFFMGRDARTVGKAVGLVVSSDTGIKVCGISPCVGCLYLVPRRRKQEICL